MFKHILLATDGSAASEHAAQLAVSLARQHRARLTVVYVVDPYPYLGIGEANPDEELLSLATELIEKKTAPFDAGAFRDHYVDALMRVIDRKAKAKGKRVIEEEEPAAVPRGSNVIDLMAALKQSVAKGGETAASAKGRSSASRGRGSGSAAKTPRSGGKTGAGQAKRKRA